MVEPSELSLIIPLGPAETEAPRLIRTARRLPEAWERIVSASRGHGVQVPAPWTTVEGDVGRGRQLNRGAAAASGRWLWFVHADSLPDQHAIDAVAEALANDARILAYHPLRFDPDGPRLSALNALGANLRSRLLGLPYGDQGVLIRRGDFQALGGFREDLARGEDLDFLVRARHAGVRLHALRGRMRSSARRYRDRGWLRTTIEHQIAAFHLIRNARARALVQPADGRSRR
ncbi:glycosyltransferase [Wenzhouxiangella marina]|uniref:Putative glycosyltransferase n=1 Tax=Wenzhouxiangella marina TaxID=1579979 RepID=A0A0K0XW25_9GAMM|nr:glycosyltransferase [Wenzhouxiangella marina]AKS41875.1 Putative glycosyltransferase [Wenzhouxiangella marina]MBB6086359.1 glycosyltransferase involved in cell wall biosynthesis [Wenzhouxiangella marina]